VQVDDSAIEAAWNGYVARQPSDPRDLTGDELSAFVHSGDPDKRRVVEAHFDALAADMDSGKGINTTPEALMPNIRARLGIPPA
jgi:hypothetical protein